MVSSIVRISKIVSPTALIGVDRPVTGCLLSMKTKGQRLIAEQPLTARNQEITKKRLLANCFVGLNGFR